MALFPREDVLPEEEATRRRSITQETGTRTLVVGFVSVLVIWFVGSRFWDAYLLRQRWPALAPAETGLSVVSTLDRRGSYDYNLFRVVQSEGVARAELTNFGWQAIFSGQHGPLCSDKNGAAIRSAIDQDSQTGYAMLVPYLAAEVRADLGDPNAFASISGDYGIDTTFSSSPNVGKHHTTIHRRSLGDLLEQFGQDGPGGKSGDTSAPSEGGTGSQQQVEHGLVIPGEVLIRTCPIVLAAQHFTHGVVEEHAESVLGGKTYSVWLDLTPEGRSRFYQWSRGHADEHLLLVLNDEVVANGRIAMTMDVDKWEITNLRDGAAAHLLVDYVNALGSRSR